MKRAFLFPGQGTQVIGMGKDIYENYEEARGIYDRASKISGIDIKKICFEGPEEVLNQTQYSRNCSKFKFRRVCSFDLCWHY